MQGAQVPSLVGEDLIYCMAWPKKKTAGKNSGVQGNWFQVIQVAKGRAGITFSSMAWSHIKSHSLHGGLPDKDHGEEPLEATSQQSVSQGSMGQLGLGTCILKKPLPGNSLEVQWLELSAFAAMAQVLPGQGTKIPQATMVV